MYVSLIMYVSFFKTSIKRLQSLISITGAGRCNLLLKWVRRYPCYLIMHPQSLKKITSAVSTLTHAKRKHDGFIKAFLKTTAAICWSDNDIAFRTTLRTDNGHVPPLVSTYQTAHYWTAPTSKLSLIFQVKRLDLRITQSVQSLLPSGQRALAVAKSSSFIFCIELDCKYTDTQRCQFFTLFSLLSRFPFG